MRLIKRSSGKLGLPPGTLVHVGEQKVETSRITVIDYDHERLEEKQVSDVEECFPFKNTQTVTWINIDGLHDTELVEKVGKHFDVHPLVLEDIVHTGQRPKVEDGQEYIYVVLDMLSYSEESMHTEAEQVSLLLGKNFVISFQERVGDVFEPCRNRIRQAKGRIRRMGADYLLYALLDCVVDHYFVVLEKLADRIEVLQDEVAQDPSREMLNRIHELKREVLLIRRSLWPARELLSGLQRSETPLVKKSTGAYLRDLYDHAVQVVDTAETFRDMVTGIQEVYLSSVSNKMNAVMQMLTIVATIFIPLTFVAGIYGMNFAHMPELRWKWAYPVGFWVVIGLVVAGMIIWLKRRRWL